MVYCYLRHEVVNKTSKVGRLISYHLASTGVAPTNHNLISLISYIQLRIHLTMRGVISFFELFSITQRWPLANTMWERSEITDRNDCYNAIVKIYFRIFA